MSSILEKRVRKQFKQDNSGMFWERWTHGQHSPFCLAMSSMVRMLSGQIYRADID